tara:strand:+ start:847 stop:1092 length:246 start_codon:yes stop_codon:yes gene_type:complete
MTKSYFASFEAEIRESLKGEEVLRDLVREMAQKILSKQTMLKPRIVNNMQFSTHGVVVEFSDVLVDGVVAIIMDELKKSAK